MVERVTRRAGISPQETAAAVGAPVEAAETGYVSEEATQDAPPATLWPGVMHTGAQSVIRDGVQVLTDRPEESDEPVPGRRIAAEPKVW